MKRNGDGGDDSDGDNSDSDYDSNDISTLESLTNVTDSELKDVYRRQSNLIRELESFSESDYMEQGVDKKEFITRTKEYIKKYF